MYVDFHHLSCHNHADPQFITNLAHQFTRYEEDLRRALEEFMTNSALENQGLKKSYFQIAIYNLPSMNKIRDLRTINLGRLMSIYGTVTRTTDAKPELLRGAFQCLECTSIVKNVE